MKKRFKVCVNMSMCLDELTSKRHVHYAVALPRSEAERTHQFASNEMYCFEKAENIRNYSVSLMVRKNFECMPEVNEIVKQALEAGLIKKWSSDGQSLRQHENFNSQKNNLIPKLSNISLMLIGFIVTMLVVSVEFVMNNRIDALNHQNFMIFVDKLFRARLQFRSFTSGFETIW